MNKQPKKQIYISKTKAVELIEQSQGKNFTVEFKKQDGNMRTLNGRTGVKKHVTANNPSANKVNGLGYIRVFEQKKPGTKVRGEYRLVNKQTITKLRINKKHYAVK